MFECIIVLTFCCKAILYGAIAGGAALLILIAIIIVVVCVMRRRRGGSKNNDIGWFIVLWIVKYFVKSKYMYICCFYIHDRYEINVIKQQQ